MHVENKPTLLSDVTDVIWCAYLNFCKISINLKPENLDFWVEAFYTKIFYYEKIWSHTVSEYQLSYSCISKDFLCFLFSSCHTIIKILSRQCFINYVIYPHCCQNRYGHMNVTYYQMATMQHLLSHSMTFRSIPAWAV